jgi:hypothetical protein
MSGSRLGTASGDGAHACAPARPCQRFEALGLESTHSRILTRPTQCEGDENDPAYGQPALEWHRDALTAAHKEQDSTEIKSVETSRHASR